MRSSITFLESPATDLAHAMATNINMLFPEGRANGRVIFMYDVKSWNDRSTEQRDPWKNLPTLDAAHLQKVVTATLSQESQIFQGNDMFFVWDGRRLDSGKKIKKFINSQKASDSEILLMTVLSTRSQSDRRLCWQLPNLSLATVCVYVCAAFEVSG